MPGAAAERAPFNPRRHVSRKAYCAFQEEQAQTRLDALRAQQHAAIEAAAGRLREALSQQARLLEKVKAGKLNARTANERNRRLTEEVHTLREEIAWRNRLLIIESPEELGGFADLPLHAYVREIRRAGGAGMFSITRTDRISVALAVVLVAALALGTAYHLFWRDTVRFALEPLETREGILRLTCENDSLHPITLYVPWSMAAEPATPEQAYGADLYIRAVDEDTFRLFATSGKAWLHRGRPTTMVDPIDVGPGLSAEVQLDLSQLRTPAAGIETLRVVCSRGDGKEIAQFTRTFPQIDAGTDTARER